MSRARKRSPAVLGLDLSLTSPAAVVIPEGWEIGDWESLRRLSWVPDAPGDLADKYSRLAGISWTVLEFAKKYEVGYLAAFVEDYAFSRSSSAVTKLAELGGVVRVDFWRSGARVVRPVVASSARRLLLGKLPKKHAKVAVQQALYAHGAPFENDDECDAFVVANFGLSELGYEALTLA